MNKLISALEIEGKIEKNPNNISEAQTNYYQTLYSEKINEKDPSYSENLNIFLKNNNMPKLSEEQKELCKYVVVTF